MQHSVEIQQQSYNARRAITAITLAVGLLGTAGCAAQESDPNPTATVATAEPTREPTAEPVVDPTPEENPVATGTFAKFKQRVDSAENDPNATITIANEDFYCTQLLALGVKANEAYTDCTELYSPVTDDRNTNRVFNAVRGELERTANVVAKAKPNIDPLVISYMLFQSCAAVYNSDNTLDKDTIIAKNEFPLILTYRSGLADISGEQPTQADMRMVFDLALAKVCNVADIPSVAAESAPLLPESELPTPSDVPNIDVLVDDARYTHGDNSETIPLSTGEDEFTCDNLLGGQAIQDRLCSDYDLGVFTIARDNYQTIASEAGLAEPAVAAFVTFYAVREIEAGSAESYSSEHMRDEIFRATAVEVDEAAITAVGDVLGASERYPLMFASATR